MKVAKENISTYVKEVSKRIGNLLRDSRLDKGMSLRELARKSGVCIASISDVENANKLPRLLIIIRLAEALEIPFEKILGKDVI